uniref:Uncharacterized protein n=1 Tax=Meloidogyne incognita TaxID=6306 RepID=A0A914M160_MELIC
MQQIINMRHKFFCLTISHQYGHGLIRHCKSLLEYKQDHTQAKHQLVKLQLNNLHLLIKNPQLMRISIRLPSLDLLSMDLRQHPLIILRLNRLFVHLQDMLMKEKMK